MLDLISTCNVFSLYCILFSGTQLRREIFLVFDGASLGPESTLILFRMKHLLMMEDDPVSDDLHDHWTISEMARDRKLDKLRKVPRFGTQLIDVSVFSETNTLPKLLFCIFIMGLENFGPFKIADFSAIGYCNFYLK